MLGRATKFNDTEAVSKNVAELTIAKNSRTSQQIIESETTSRFQRRTEDSGINKVFQDILKDGYRRQPNALILVPTRELAIQVKEEAEKLLIGTKFKVAALYTNPK